MNDYKEKSIKKVYIISFSPTGTSLKAAEMIAGEFRAETVVVDLCEALSEKIEIEQNSVCIFSAPVYGGRIPETAVERLAEIKGENTPAILCVTYGNRAVEDALIELSDLVEEKGFCVIAGCSIITEHNIMHVYGTGRPDHSDREGIEAFAQEIVEKIKSGNGKKPSLPGNHAYKEWRGMSLPILVHKEKCISCGLCALKCPVRAISPDGLNIDEKTCICCMRCIKICPKGSRYVEENYLAALIERLKPACESRKKNEFYL